MYNFEVINFVLCPDGDITLSDILFGFLIHILKDKLFSCFVKFNSDVLISPILFIYPDECSSALPSLPVLVTTTTPLKDPTSSIYFANNPEPS